MFELLTQTANQATVAQLICTELQLCFYRQSVKTQGQSFVFNVPFEMTADFTRPVTAEAWLAAVAQCAPPRETEGVCPAYLAGACDLFSPSMLAYERCVERQERG